jgi:integrative and conjugative element protein (TIGR02256 family)
MKAIFSDRAFAAVLAETTEKITTETGGLFLGTVRDNTWYIIEAIDPGPKSIFEIAYFEYDREYTQHLINKVANLYGKRLDLIGLWHRHPGSFDQFSSTDDDTNARYAAMRKEGAISGLVNIDPRFRFTMYHVMSPCKYQTIPYEAGDDLIPPELLAYRTPDRFYDLMEKRMRSGGRNAERPAWRRSVSFESFLHFVQPYLSEYECNEVSAGFSVVDPSTPDQLIDEVLDDLTFMTEKAGVQVTASIQGQYLVLSQETAEKTVGIYFMNSATHRQPVLFYGGKCYLYHSGMLEEAALKAGADKERKAAEAESAQRGRRPGSVFDSFIKIMKPVRKEDEKKEDENED